MFFLLRLDFRLDEADCAFSEGGMEGPAADLVKVSTGAQRKLHGFTYSGLDIVVACFPFLFLEEYVGCWGSDGTAGVGGGGGCWSGTLARLERLVEGACAGATSASRSALRLRVSVRRDGAGGCVGSAGVPAAGAPAERDAPACRAAWRAEDRVAGLSDMSK